MDEEAEKVIKNLSKAHVRNRRVKFLQKIGLVVTFFIIITFLSLFVKIEEYWGAICI